MTFAGAMLSQTFGTRIASTYGTEDVLKPDTIDGSRCKKSDGLGRQDRRITGLVRIAVYIVGTSRKSGRDCRSVPGPENRRIEFRIEIYEGDQAPEATRNLGKTPASLTATSAGGFRNFKPTSFLPSGALQAIFALKDPMCGIAKVPKLLLTVGNEFSRSLAPFADKFRMVHLIVSPAVSKMPVQITPVRGNFRFSA